MTVATHSRPWLRVGFPFMVLRLGGQASEFAAFVLLARGLAPAEFGRLSVAFLVARYLGLIGDWGASVRGTRDVARGADAGAIHALIRRRVTASVALAAAFFAGATLLDGPALGLIAVVVLARGMNRDWLALGRERGVSSGTASVVQGFALLVAASTVHSLSGAAAALAFGYGAGLVASLALNRLPGHAPAIGAQEVRVDGWILGSVLADQITISADTFLLAALRSSAAAGVYAAVYRIPNAWMTLVGLVMLGMVAPTARRMATAPIAQARALRQQSLRLGFAAGGAILASAVPAYIAVPVIFGSSYDAGRASLSVLMLATAVMAVGASLHPLYFALARDRDVFTLALGGTVVNLLANAVAIPLWGMLGAAMATLLAQVFLVGLLLRRLHRIVDDAGA